MPRALEVRGLVKHYDGLRAVDDFSFGLDAGEFVGLLGPNGAGKTTTIKCLTGLIRPTAGDVHYFGKDFFRRTVEAKRLIGVVAQQSNVDRDLTAYENLKLHALLHGVPAAERHERIMKALDFAGIAEHRDRRVRTFSGGMKRRLVIVRALLHEPKVLFLDEPTVGLDPQIRRGLWDLIVKVNQMKKTAILLTTHYIEEAEKLCGRVLILDRGRVIAEGAPDVLKRNVGKYVLERFMEDRIEEDFFERREDALDVLRACTRTCKVREVTLEDVFIRLTGRRIVD